MAPGSARLCYSSQWWAITPRLPRLPLQAWGGLPVLPSPPAFPALLCTSSKLAGLWRLEKRTALERWSSCCFLPPQIARVLSLHQI